MEKPSETLLAELLRAKQALYLCLLNMPNDYLLQDADAQSLMMNLTKDRQIQAVFDKALTIDVIKQ